LPGKALAVGLVLWQTAGMTNNREVNICQANQSALGLNEDSTRRGINALENAGLIEVKRRPGQGLKVTLLDVHPGVDLRTDDHGTRCS
jgi:hypothetical protein